MTFRGYFSAVNSSSYGESHCRSVGCIIDGCPPGLPLTEDNIQPQLSRRRPGQSALSTPRDEKDRVAIESGTECGLTLGTPIGLRVCNEDQRPGDYGGLTTDAYPRPSHADWTYLQKYGVKASSGGGRSSARETVARVAAGAVADHFLQLAHGIEVVAFVSSVGPEQLFSQPDAASDPGLARLLTTITRATVDSFAPVRCPDTAAAGRMANVIAAARDAHDSIGGTVTCVIRNLPAGLGEPAFDKLEAALAHAMLSIPATKGFEIGSGFAGTALRGSQHNDAFESVAAAEAAADANTTTSDGTNTGDPRPRRLVPRTNNSGGIQGGISNAAPVYFRVAFKPAATIGLPQETAAYDGTPGVLAAKGRHDPSVVPRAVPVVEAMTSLVVADALLAQAGRAAVAARLPEVKMGLPVRPIYGDL